jgi:hypothetical protein
MVCAEEKRGRKEMMVAQSFMIAVVKWFSALVAMGEV